MEQYFGVIEILKVENIFPTNTQDKGGEKVMLMDHVRFVHYPDCQQMSLWLPECYREYQDAIIRNTVDQVIIFDQKVEHIISGAIKITIDTLFICPGTYELTISKINGIVHRVHFDKYSEGHEPKALVTNHTNQQDLDSETIEYSDSFGYILPNQDLMLRQNIMGKILNQYTRRLEYVSQGRSGEVIYHEGKKSIKFYMEMGGGDCVFYLDIPSIAEWEKATNFPLSQREEIISFVSDQTQRDQASSCTYNISETTIAYYRKG